MLPDSSHRCLPRWAAEQWSGRSRQPQILGGVLVHTSHCCSHADLWVLQLHLDSRQPSGDMEHAGYDGGGQRTAWMLLLGGVAVAATAAAAACAATLYVQQQAGENRAPGRLGRRVTRPTAPPASLHRGGGS